SSPENSFGAPRSLTLAAFCGDDDAADAAAEPGVSGEGVKQCGGHHTSTCFSVHALTSHSRCGPPRTSSSMKRPSVVARRISPSVTDPKPDTSWLTGVLENWLRKR